jgi:Transposase DDE domain group 1
MPTECSAPQFEFGVVEGRRVVAAFDGGAVTSDAGALLLGATDKAIGLIERFAGCFSDGRSRDRIEHELTTLVGQRVFGLALGYEDVLDHDWLRHDPVMAVLAGKLEARRPNCAPLAGKSTLNRLEHAPGGEPTRYHRIGHDAAAIEQLFVELFLDAHRKPPAQIILDLDATDDPLHGHQEGRFFHGYYDCWCYLPLYVFCGRHLLAAKLRRSNIDASAGAVEEIERIVRQIRARWRRAKILLRADSGFAREALMSWCERNRVDYVFGLARNARLEAEIAADLGHAEAVSRATGTAARAFKDFHWTTLDSWSRKRRVVAKAEWTRSGPNPRFIVTSLSAAAGDARRLYEDIYCARGEMENRMYGRLPPRKRCLRRSGMVRSAAVMYPASHAATWLRASMRSAAGSRLSSRARSSVVLSGSADPGLTGHAIVSKITLAARGNCGRLLPGGQTRTGRSSRASSCPFNATIDHAGAR